MQFYCKMMGLCFLGLTSAMAGLWMSRRMDVRLKEYKELKRALYILASEIRYSASLSDAAEMVGKRIAGGLGRVFTDLSEDMDRKEGKSLDELWSEGVRKRQRELNLDEEDCMMLCSLGKHLAGQDAELLQNQIALLEQYVQDKQERLAEEKRTKGRMYKSLVILGGILIMVVLL